MHQQSRNRFRFISAVVLLFGAVFIVRLYQLQIINGKAFAAQGERQYVATKSNVFDRGSIYFTQKDGSEVAAATLASGFIVAITPADIVDPEGTYESLQRIIPIEKEDFMNKAAKKEDPYEVVASHVSDADTALITALKLPGVRSYRETWRYYPGNTLAAHILGFVGYSGDELGGRYGLESYYNDTLKRSEGHVYVNFFAELFDNIGNVVFDRDSVEGGDLVLSVEPTVQGFLESELSGVMDEWNSDESGGIIMDPKTGEIFALSAAPTYDLNEYGKVGDKKLFANPVVQSVYEMGSIVKPLTMAAGIDTGVVTANTTYNDLGTITLNGKTISNYDGRGRGPGTSMQEVLNQSLNTGVTFVEQKMGNDRFREYMLDRYHIGEETGIDLPGERQGLVTNLSSKRDLEYANASFGQGISMTPINAVAALATLANGGHTVNPHIVTEIRYAPGRSKKITPNPPQEVLKKETTEEITRMLVNVVDKALLGGTVKIPEYSIAAKTGTAQIARLQKDGGGYYDDRYLHTFFGYFPAYDPKFIVFIYTYNPKEATFASHTLTHPFMRITKFLLHYYGIPPDRVAAAKGGTL